MPLYDVLFSLGDAQNFLLETPNGTLYSPVDILTRTNSNPDELVLETTAASALPESPSIILLSDGKLAKKITSSFYIKL